MGCFVSQLKRACGSGMIPKNRRDWHRGTSWALHASLEYTQRSFTSAWSCLLSFPPQKLAAVTILLQSQGDLAIGKCFVFFFLLAL